MSCLREARATTGGWRCGWRRGWGRGCRCGWTRQGRRNIKDFSGMYCSATRGCHKAGSGSGTTFWGFLKLLGHSKLIPWPETRAAAAKHALDRQEWRGALQNLALLEYRKPQRDGRTIRSCARRGGGGSCCATLSRVRPGGQGALLIQV
eukprot:360604-Chlamydomonas_euryale.AAC.2